MQQGTNLMALAQCWLISSALFSMGTGLRRYDGF